jgi:hypothetical protein
VKVFSRRRAAKCKMAMIWILFYFSGLGFIFSEGYFLDSSIWGYGRRRVTQKKYENERKNNRFE